MVNVGGLQASLGLDLTGFNTSLNKAQGAMQKAGRSLTGVGKTMTASVTLPVLGLGAAILKTAADFESSMNMIGAVTGATGSEFSAMQSKAKALGITTQYTASQVADAMVQLAKTGFDATQVIQAIEPNLSLAAATMSDLAFTADLTTNVMSQFGLTAAESGRIADTLAYTTNRFATTLDQVGDAMKYLGPTARAMGIGLEEASAVYGILANNGLKGSLATRALGTSLTRLAAPTEQMRGVMSQLNLDFFDAQGTFIGMAPTLDLLNDRFKGLSQETRQGALSILFGAEAIQEWNILTTEGAGSLRKFTSEIQNAGGTADRTAKAQMKGLNGALKTLKSAFEGLALAIADSGLLDWITSLATSFGNWIRVIAKTNPEILKLGVIIAGLAAAIGPLAIAFGSIATVMGVISIKVIAIVAAIAALVAGVYYLYDNWEAVKERISDWNWWRNMLIEMIQYLVQTNPFSLLIKGYNLLAEKMGGPQLPDPFQNIADGLDLLKGETKEYEHQFGSFTDSVMNMARDAKNAILGMVGSINLGGGGGGGSAPASTGGSGTSTKSIVQGLATSTGKGGPGATFGPTQNILTFVEQAKSAVLDLQSVLEGGLTNAFVTLGETIGDALSGGVDSAGSLFNKLLMMVADFAKQFGAALISAGVAALAFESLLLNPVAAIAAGVALVAAATVVKNLASKGVKGLRSGGYITEGGVFQLHRDEMVSLPAGAAVTSQRASRALMDNGSAGVGSLSTKINLRELIIQLDRERQRIGR